MRYACWNACFPLIYGRGLILLVEKAGLRGLFSDASSVTVLRVLPQLFTTLVVVLLSPLLGMFGIRPTGWRNLLHPSPVRRARRHHSWFGITPSL